MVGWRCKLKRRLVWMLALMTVTSVVMVFRVHLNQVRREKAEFIFSILGSRNTSEFVNPHVDTVLVDCLAGWVSQRALDNYQGLQSLVQEKRLVVRDVRSQPEVPRPPFVLIVVISEFGFQANRKAIRQTWYKWARREDAKVVFFLGLPSNVNVTMGEIEKEIRTYKDIVVDDHVESYYLLSVKVLRMLKWFQSTFPQEKTRPRFLVKTDHDVFNHIPNIVQYLKTVTHVENYIGGQENANVTPSRDGFSKWYTPEELWPETYFPPYLNGPSYFLSEKVVPLIYEAALGERIFQLEDVFLTGIIPQILRLPLYEVPLMHIFTKKSVLEERISSPDNCTVMHPVQPEQMHQYYNNIERAQFEFPTENNDNDDAYSLSTIGD